MQNDVDLAQAREGSFDIFDDEVGLYSHNAKGLFGYTTDRTWNGWACPLFPRESVEQILHTSYWAARTRYDPASDSYSFLDEDLEKWDTFQPRTIILRDGHEVTVWGIGYCLWTWEEGCP